MGMQFVFNERKAGQAAAWLLRRHDGVMPYLSLIKLLYLADRRALIETGYPITGDRPVSMPHGPVLSRVYGLVKGANSTAWHEFVTPPDGWDVRAAGCEEIGKLSEYETDILDEVDEKFGSLHRWELRNLTHALPEWQDPRGSSVEIDPAVVLRAEGVSEEDIKEFAAQAEAIRAFEAIFR